jgi:hypothetical protein
MILSSQIMGHPRVQRADLLTLGENLVKKNRWD